MKSRYLRKPVCVICGNDGLDKCVLFNLVRLYERLGFSILISRNPVDCHLLVISRGDDVHIPSEFNKSIPIHVYNYVGNNLFKILDKIKDYQYYVIAPSQDLLDSNLVLPSKGIISYPPVYSDSWISFLNKKGVDVKYDFSHIGNLKVDYGAKDDEYSQALEKLIYEQKIYVWGNGWNREKIGSYYQGTVDVYNVKHVYARTDIGLGLMYPFQRELGTFSSRFWQAPLNGTILLSEPNRYIGVIPGIIEGHLSDIHASSYRKISREKLIEESRSYWNRESDLAENRIKAILNATPPAHHRLRNHLNNNFISSRMKLSFVVKSFTEFSRNLGFLSSRFTNLY